MFEFIFSEYKGFALGMQSLRLDAIANKQENAAKAVFESKRIQIHFYKPSAMKEQK